MHVTAQGPVQTLLRFPVFFPNDFGFLFVSSSRSSARYTEFISFCCCFSLPSSLSLSLSVMCSDTGCHYVALGCLELRYLPASAFASQVLGLEMCATPAHFSFLFLRPTAKHADILLCTLECRTSEEMASFGFIAPLPGFLFCGRQTLRRVEGLLQLNPSHLFFRFTNF